MKSRKGFTLMEVTIALALWLILSAGVFFVWQHSAHSGMALLEQQSAFENARISMDALIMNFQMAQTITLQTDNNDILQLLTLTQRDPQGRLHDYRFYFDVNAAEGTAKHHRLEFGTNNEFAANIAEIRIIHNADHMQITITTGCEEPIILRGSACVRFKCVTVI